MYHLLPRDAFHFSHYLSKFWILKNRYKEWPYYWIADRFWIHLIIVNRTVPKTLFSYVFVTANSAQWDFMNSLFISDSSWLTCEPWADDVWRSTLDFYKAMNIFWTVHTRSKHYNFSCNSLMSEKSLSWKTNRII